MKFMRIELLLGLFVLSLGWFFIVRPITVGYTGAELQRIAEPLAVAVRQAGASSYDCSPNTGARILYKGVELSAFDSNYLHFMRSKDVAPSDSLVCPTGAGHLVVSPDGAVALKAATTFQSVDEIERMFKSVDKAEVQQRFTRLAQAIVAASRHWDEYLRVQQAVQAEEVRGDRAAQKSWKHPQQT